ncbi:MAG TPA: Nif3-like dinuclear metal center hexameric protein [Jatrophihabitans sp.]
MPTLGELTATLQEWFPPSWAESWDAVGLVCGDPGEAVSRVLLAIDPLPETTAEAERVGAQLLLTHHPLFLTGVHGVPATDPKGALVHRMIRAGLAHFVAHTNADVAAPGVSDALADVLGLHELRPLQPVPEPVLDKLVVFVPRVDAERLIDVLAAAGAGALGDYDRCAWVTDGTGTFRPLTGATPAVGGIGEIERVAESRVEMIVPAHRRAAVIAALHAAHPYEEPAFDLLAGVAVPSARGTGRIGDLTAPMTLREFTMHAAAVLPATAWGVRAAGDPDRLLRSVAVCGGSGGSLAETARRSGADMLLTADLKHHATLETVNERGADGIALVDAAHWATEAPWLDVLAVRLREHFGTSLDVHVSRIVTDPWTLHAHAPENALKEQENS